MGEWNGGGGAKKTKPNQTKPKLAVYNYCININSGINLYEGGIRVRQQNQYSYRSQIYGTTYGILRPFERRNFLDRKNGRQGAGHAKCF